MAEIEGLDGNEIRGTFKELGKVHIKFVGNGNKLIFDKGVILKGVRILFRGSNAIVQIDAGCNLRGFFIVDNNATIHINERTKFNKPCVLEASNNRKIHMGKNCLMANVNFYTSDGVNVKDISDQTLVNPSADIHVDDHVWIAENSLVLKGGVIGRDSVIAAGSFVFDTIPANSIAAGNPAKVIRQGISWDDERL